MKTEKYRPLSKSVEKESKNTNYPPSSKLASNTVSNSNNNYPVDPTINVQWLKFNSLRVWIYAFVSLVSLGLLPILGFFYPNVRLRLRCSECSPDEAEFAIVTLNNSDRCISTCTHYASSLTTERIVVVEANCLRFCASSHDNFLVIQVPEVPQNYLKFITESMQVDLNNKMPSLEEEQQILKAQYGYNVMELPETSGIEILVRIAFSPFFMFQYFAVAIWMSEGYVFYSVLILIITLAAVVVTTQESMFNLERLRSLAGKSGHVQLAGDNASIKSKIQDRCPDCQNDDGSISDSLLLPGDIFYLFEGQVVPCDCVLLGGRVVVDESMLTGESVPVTKTPIEINGIIGDASILTKGSLYKPTSISLYGSDNPSSKGLGNLSGSISTDGLATKRSGSILFGGTKVRACHHGECVAVVYRTGFRSAKGQLVASLLNPKEGFLTFISDALLVVLCMLLLTTALYGYVAYELHQMGASTTDIILRYFDAVTIAVPPALTACLTVATAISIARLKEKDIFVSDTSRINWAGTINIASFDKTGTLTEDKFVLHGVQIAEKHNENEVGSVHLIEKDLRHLDLITLETMASCHNLSVICDDHVGDPLEVELLRASGWSLSKRENHVTPLPPGQNLSSSNCYKVLKHFEFTPERLRAGSLIQRPDGSCWYLLKGSPEMILAMVNAASIPDDIDSRLRQLGKKGLRVIALAYRRWGDSVENAMSMTQERLEDKSELIFHGVFCLSSRLKPDTKLTISELNKASIQANMITGDQIYTAIAVATECGILLEATATINPLFIIDEKDGSNEVTILDSTTDRPIDISLEKLLNLTAVSTLMESKTISAHDIAEASYVATAVVTNARPVTPEFNFEGKIQLAVTGRGLVAVQRNFSNEIVQYLVRSARVFARTKPADKKHIVEELIDMSELDRRLVRLLFPETGYLTATSVWDCCASSSVSGWESHESDTDKFAVLFCGDGANDMSALRAATVGVSLCDSETSVAAPVTSKLQNPHSVVDVIREGRCSLITAYVLVMFNIMYGVIQLFMAILLYQFGLVAGDYMYLTQDLFYTLVLGLAISITLPSDTFDEEIPPKRFLTHYLMFILISQLALFMVFQVLGLWVLSQQSFYTRFVADNPLETTYSYEATTVDCMALGQLMIASVVSTIGEPFRKPWYSNSYHVVALIFQCVWLLYQIFGDSKFSEDFLDLKPLPHSFGITLLGLIVLNAVVSYLCVYFAQWLKSSPMHLRRKRFANFRGSLVQLCWHIMSSQSVHWKELDV